MWRKVCAAVVLVLGAGVAFAEDIRAVITKVEGDKVTFAPIEGKGKNITKGEEKTLPVAKDVKVVAPKFNKETKKREWVDLENGLKNEVFSKIGEKGIRTTIVTDSDNKKIMEIRLGGPRNALAEIFRLRLKKDGPLILILGDRP
jgi:hypothetical protein